MNFGENDLVPPSKKSYYVPRYFRAPAVYATKNGKVYTHILLSDLKFKINNIDVC